MKKNWLSVAFIAAVLMGCSDKPKEEESIITTAPVTMIKSVGNMTITVESDHSAGHYGVIISDKYISKSPIEFDADLGFADGNFYIAERDNVNNLILLTETGDEINREPFNSVPNFNARGICGNGNNKIFVGSYENSEIIVFEKENGKIANKNSIKLSLAPDAKLQDLKFANGKIYAALQFMGADWLPSAKSKVLEMDENGNILREFESNFMNVSQIEIRGNNLFILDTGDFYAIDGGITRIDLTSKTATTIFDGKTAGFDLDKIEFVSDTNGYIIHYNNWDDLFVVNFSLSGNNISFGNGTFSDINPVSAYSYNKSTNTLWLAKETEVRKYQF